MSSAVTVGSPKYMVGTRKTEFIAHWRLSHQLCRENIGPLSPNSDQNYWGNHIGIEKDRYRSNKGIFTGVFTRRLPAFLLEKLVKTIKHCRMYTTHFTHDICAHRLFYTNCNFEQLLFKAFFDALLNFGSIDPKSGPTFLFFYIIIFQRVNLSIPLAPLPEGRQTYALRDFFVQN